MSSTSLDQPAGADAPDIRNAAQGSLVERARQRDTQAITTMFRQFIPPEEPIVAVEYLGSVGMIFRTHSFACVTDRRVASLQVKGFGQIIYQDGLIEAIKSGVLYQPSRLASTILGPLATILTLGMINRVSGDRKRVGLVMTIADGVPVYVLSHRKHVTRANAVYRSAIGVRTNGHNGARAIATSSIT